MHSTKIINIHLLQDSPYSNWFIANCAKSNNNRENLFYTLSQNPVYLNLNVIKFLNEDIERQALINLINNSITSNFYNLYIHFLDEEKAKFVNELNKKHIKIIWILWSEDLYSIPKLKFKKYDKYSYNYFESKKIKSTLKQKIIRFKMIYIDRLDWNKKKWKTIYKFIKRSDICVTGIEQEAVIIQKKINCTIKFQPFAYISPNNDVVLDADNKKVYIQVGNSSDPANNHYEAILQLAKLGVEDKMLLPLSYGDKDYAEQLLKDIYTHVKPSQIYALKDFMDKNEYYQILNKVKVAIFPHNIQQAFGNIIALIKLGAKVFLKNENLLFKQFKTWGIKVYSIEDEFTLDEINTPLDSHIKQQNKTIIAEIFSEEKISLHYNSLLSL